MNGPAGISTVMVTGLLMGLAADAGGQSIPRSQRGTVSQRVSDAEITVEYSRPVARGRDIFGGLIRFGRMWHPGADSATRITVSRDVRIGGEPLPAGSYSLWTVPRREEWTVIFSTVADTWHTRYPGAEDDALRITVMPEEAPHMETLAFYFPLADGRVAELVLHWGTTAVRIGIEVDP